MISFKQFVKRNRFATYGLPFVILIVAGSFGLEKFAKLRYVFRRSVLLTPEEAEKLGIKMKTGADKPTLESEYEKVKQMNLDHWENVRVPRPWHEDVSAKSS